MATPGSSSSAHRRRRPRAHVVEPWLGTQYRSMNLSFVATGNRPTPVTRGRQLVGELKMIAAVFERPSSRPWLKDGTAPHERRRVAPHTRRVRAEGRATVATV